MTGRLSHRTTVAPPPPDRPEVRRRAADLLRSMAADLDAARGDLADGRLDRVRERLSANIGRCQGIADTLEATAE